MEIAFYLAAVVAVISTILVITRLNAVHALLYLIVSFLSVALIFFLLGAHFAAALEAIIYAGAILVLFVFVIMMVNLGHHAIEHEKKWLGFRMWIGPGLLTAFLMAELIYVLAKHGLEIRATSVVKPEWVGISLFGPYLLGVELASLLLMAAVLGTYHLGRQSRREKSTGEDR
jgi:NADH-quinone oxidoreductase subunit J